MLSAGVEGVGIRAETEVTPSAGVLVALIVLLRSVRPKLEMKSYENLVKPYKPESSDFGAQGVVGPTEADFPTFFEESDLLVPSSLTFSSDGKCFTLIRA